MPRPSKATLQPRRREAQRLATRAAESRAFIKASDYPVDRRGGRPAVRTIDGSPQPGVAGVVKAQGALLIHMNRCPTAMDYRRLLDSQRESSRAVAARLNTPGLERAQTCTRRAATYTRLHVEARNLGGHVGSGGLAVAEAANAISRLRRLPRGEPLSERAIRDVALLCTAVDARMADLFEQGARGRLYFVSAKVPRFVDNDGAMTHGVRKRLMPITTPVQTELIGLIGLIRQRLLPTPTSSQSPAGARASRLDLSKAITHRPAPRGAPTDAPSL